MLSSLWRTRLIVIICIIFNIFRNNIDRTVFDYKIITLYIHRSDQSNRYHKHIHAECLVGTFEPNCVCVCVCVVVFIRARSSNILLLSLSSDNTMLFISYAFPLRYDEYLIAYLSRAPRNIIISWYRTWPPKTWRRRRRPRKHAVKTCAYRGTYEYSSLHLYTG